MSFLSTLYCVYFLRVEWFCMLQPRSLKIPDPPSMLRQYKIFQVNE